MALARDAGARVVAAITEQKPGTSSEDDETVRTPGSIRRNSYGHRLVAERRQHPDINITPMIDVLLVLAIFMIAQPLLQKSIDVQLPVEKQEQASEPALRIVLRSMRRQYTINTQPVAQGEPCSASPRFANRPDKVLPSCRCRGHLPAGDRCMDARCRVTVLGAVLP